MLEFLHRALGESRDRGDFGVVLEFHNPSPQEGEESYGTLPSYDESPLLTAFGTRVDVAKELDIDNAEAIALLKDLESEEWLQLDYASNGPFIDAGEVAVNLTEKGWAAIGILLAPKEILLEKLDTMAEAIGDLQGIPPDEQWSAIGALEELKRFVGALEPESAVELIGKLPCVLGLGSR